MPHINHSANWQSITKACQAVPRFTDLTIRSLSEGVHFDEKLPGFGIRIGKHKKTWLVVKQPNRTKVRLGHFPDMSLALARKKALVALGSPHETSDYPTFPDARTEYLAQGKWRPKTRYETTRTLTRHFHWQKSIDKITHRDVSEAIETIEKPGEARAAHRDLCAFFNWCVPRYLKHSPCTGLKPPSRYIPREKTLTEKELAAVWHACETQGNFGVIIRLCLLTAARKSEVVGPKTLTDNTVTFLATKNGKDHTLPITPYIRSLFEQVQSIASWNKPKQRLDEAAGVTGYTIHDCRRTAATFMARHADPFIVERILNHSMPSLQRTYNRHNYIEAMRPVIEKHEDFLQNLLAKKETPDGRPLPALLEQEEKHPAL